MVNSKNMLGLIRKIASIKWKGYCGPWNETTLRGRAEKQQIREGNERKRREIERDNIKERAN